MSEQATETYSGTEAGATGGVESFFDNVKMGGLSEEPPAPVEQTTVPATQQAPASQPTQPTQQQPTPPTTPAVVPPAPVQQSLSLSPEQLAAVVKAARPDEPSQVKEPTPQEVDEKFAVVRPTDEDIATVFRGGPEGTKKMTDLLHGAAKMGATIASHHLIGQMRELKNEIAEKLKSFEPAREVAARQEMQQHTQTFYSKFPHWTKAHEPLLIDVYKKLEQAQFRGTPEQVYAKVNEEALNLARAIMPGFAAASASGTPAATNGSGNPRARGSTPALPQSQMTQLPSGGSGGSGGQTTSSGGNKSGPEALFS